MTGLLVPLHGLGSRQDLPLPLPAVVAGAVLVLVLSFGVLALAWRKPRWHGVPSGRPLPGLTGIVDSRWFRTTLAMAGLSGFAWIAAALWFGRDLVTNPAFGFTYVWLWVGLVPVSLLLGPVWKLANPLLWLFRLLQRIGLPADGLRPLPGPTWQRIGSYPAAAGLLGFGWLELVQPDNNTLLVLRGWWVAWVLAVLGGSVLFGRRWVAAADPFEVYSSLVSRAGCWQRIDGQVRLANPLRNLATTASPAGTWAVVAALLGATAFDSLTATSWWVRTTQASALPRPVWGTLGLLAMVALVALTFALGVRGVGRLRRAGHLDLLAASLVPIVIGYAVAHYLSLLVLEGQRTLINLSDPLGLGWDAFGTAELAISQLWLELPQVTAGIQLAAIVGGHLAGVLVAHELSLLVLPTRRRTIGQLPLLAVMVGYTCGGLLLLFSP